uniref:Uncharacterized protein n=1 Tax=Utricularia reniformis TaxID=192314 RepID=A0A1Y0AZF9_9LAMI|nr:hypothetical protein AEK19_MT0296 [Utricularia reniformis]ART30572.1 hypothetical protein AEK19_MT0296 [Utricularia reniformis]
MVKRILLDDSCSNKLCVERSTSPGIEMGSHSASDSG